MTKFLTHCAALSQGVYTPTLMRDAYPQSELIECKENGAAVCVIPCDDRISIVCRGTEFNLVAILNAIGTQNWAESDFREFLKDFKADAAISRVPYQGGGLVHAGFDSQFVSVRKDVADAVATLRSTNLRLPVVSTGHSLGGALAVLLGDYVEADSVVTFGCPRIGNAAFGHGLRQRHPGQWHCRVVHASDIVTRLPLPIRFKHDCNALHLAGGRLAEVGALDLWLSQINDGISFIKAARDHSIVTYTERLDRIGV